MSCLNECMNLDDAQKRKVTEWIGQGLKLSEIQKRMADELALHLTYMEVRLLADDLKLTPKDVEPAKPVDLPGKQPGAGPGGLVDEGATPGMAGTESLAPSALPGAAGVSIKVDQVTRAGALVSGSVTFSDGNAATWYLDQLGRLGLAPKQQGYKPSPGDLQAFQMELQNELARMGF